MASYINTIKNNFTKKVQKKNMDGFFLINVITYKIIVLNKNIKINNCLYECGTKARVQTIRNYNKIK